jgi:rubrerythrin
MDYDNLYNNQADSRYVNSYIGYPSQGQNQWSFQTSTPVNANQNNLENIQRASQVVTPLQGQMQNNQGQIGNNQGIGNYQNMNVPRINQSIGLSNQGNQYVNDELISLNEAISLIKQSVGDEKEDENFYDTLIKSAPTSKAKEVITSIRNDERKHNAILRNVYFRLTGNILQSDTSAMTSDVNIGQSQFLNQNVTTSNIMQSNQNGSASTQSSQNNSSMSQLNQNSSSINNNATYKNNLVKALFGETDAVIKYRRIMGAMPDNSTYTLIMSIMTDELRHADKYNYLIHESK